MEIEEETAREYINLPVSLFRNIKFYILEASSDSILDVGVDDGDLVVVRTDCTAEVGDIIVAPTKNNENTPKVFGGFDEDT